MTRDIRVTEEGGIVRVVYRGDVEYQATTEMLGAVARVAAEKQVKRLLFDIREANYQHYYLETMRHSEEAPGLGIDRTFRVAFLGSADNPMLRYIENVTVNRGYQVKAFTEQLEAEAWLRNAP